MNSRVSAIKSISVLFDLIFSEYIRRGFINDLLAKLADYYRTQRIENNGRIIEFPDAFSFGPRIRFYNNKIEPAFTKFVSFETIDKMNKKHEKHKDHKENHGFPEAEEKIVT